MTRTIVGLEAPSPIMNGAGIIKTMEDFEKLIDIPEIGVLNVGSITKDKREGNPGDTFYDGNGFTLNTLGLPNRGLRYYEEHLPRMVEKAHDKGKLLMLSIVGFDEGDLALLADMADNAGVDLIEINGGCPNIWSPDRFGAIKQKPILSFTGEGLMYAFNEATKTLRKAKVGIKLSPFTDPVNLEKTINGLMLLGKRTDTQTPLSFITSTNTIPNCSFTKENEEQVITPNNGFAGMGGGNLFPFSYGNVRQICNQLMKGKDIEVFACGGITNGVRAHAMMKAGATGVQIMSAYYRTGDRSVFPTIAAELYELEMTLQ